MMRAMPLPTCLLLVLATAASAQVVRLAERDSGALEVRARPGDTVHVAVRADLGRHGASGLTLFVRVPDTFRVVAPATPGPFEPGELFAGAVVVRNAVMAATEAPEMGDAWQLLEYTAILGATPDRSRSGSGVIACFRLVCPGAASGSVEVHTSPVHESRLVLADGRSEQPILAAPPLQIRVDPATAVEPRAWAAIKRRGR